jgi:hypothetical protein
MAVAVHRPVSALLLLVAASCTHVGMHERRDVARAAMEDPFAPTQLEFNYRDRVYQTQVAGALPGRAPGGGCGCTH